MEFIAETMHASVDLSRVSSHDSVNNPPSRPSSSSSSTPPFLSSAYQPHPGIDTNLTIFYRPAYPGGVEQQSTMFTPQPQYCAPSLQERPPSQPTSTTSAEGDNNFDSVITNGMRVMHFLDQHPPDVFHQYPSIYMPDGLTYSSGYHPSGPVTTPDSYSAIPSSGSTFSPVVIVPQPLYYNHNSHSNNTTSNTSTSSNSVGFQPYQPTQHQQSINTDLYDSKLDLSGEQKAIKRKNSNVSDSTGDEVVCLDNIQEVLPACRICGDISSGIHYGVWACEGCKGFFRRAMMRTPEDPLFICHYGSECDVTRKNRNKCRACRLRRCQESGMFFGAGLKISKEAHKKRRQFSPPMLIPALSRRPTTPLDLQEWTEFVVSAHTASFTPVSDIFTSRFAAVLSLAPDQLWPPGCDLSKRGFQAIQHFAHSLPFVSFLPPDLRTHLLESNALDVMILRVAFRFCPQRDSFLFPPGAEVSLPCLSATLLGSTIVNRIAFLGRLVVRLGISSEELAFLSTLALLSPDSLGGGFLPGHVAILYDIEAKVLTTFYGYMRQRWSSRPFLVGKLVALLSDIRALQHSVSLQTWLEPAGSSSHST